MCTDYGVSHFLMKINCDLITDETHEHELLILFSLDVLINKFSFVFNIYLLIIYCRRALYFVDTSL